MEPEICHIVGAGEFSPRGLIKGRNDFVIAADGGCAHLMRAGVLPDLLVGDMDSLPTVPDGVPIVRHPVEKDDTDMALALREGAARGYRSFRLYGGGGGRIDHFLANLQLAAGASLKGLRIVLVCPDFDAYALTDGALCLPAAPKGTLVSVFCMGSVAEGVSLCGLKYSLQDAQLTAFFPLGVSNEHTGAPVEIRVKKGTLIALDYGPSMGGAQNC